jgi:hypothetical protein
MGDNTAMDAWTDEGASAVNTAVERTATTEMAMNVRTLSPFPIAFISISIHHSGRKSKNPYLHGLFIVV